MMVCAIFLFLFFLFFYPFLSSFPFPFPYYIYIYFPSPLLSSPPLPFPPSVHHCTASTLANTECSKIHNRRSLAPAHHPPTHLPSAPSLDKIRHSHCARQRCPPDGGDLPGFAQGSVDARLQRAGVREGHSLIAQLSRHRLPFECGCCGADKAGGSCCC